MLGPGDFIGLLVMLIETEYRATIICTGEVRAFEFRRSVVQDLIGSDVSLSAAFAEIIRQSFSGIAEELKKIQADLDRSLSGAPLEITTDTPAENSSDTRSGKTGKKTKKRARKKAG
ncbi:MAG: cyclic nucleotide-binding domain-containing protein, partial [Methyloligellaceae bacterium]